MDSSIFSFLLGGVAGSLLFFIIYTLRLGSFRQHALLIVRQAEVEADQKRSALALELTSLKSQHDARHQQELSNLESQERHLKSQSQQLARDIDRFKKDQSQLGHRKKEIEEYERKVQEEHRQALEKLEQLSNISFDEARHLILQRAQEESQQELELNKAAWQRSFERECRSRSVSLLLSAVERKTQGLTKETFVTEIPLKDRHFIPRCIGKDGRNIQTLEELLDVSVIIEEHVPRLLISAHDGKARFIAKTAIEQLIEEEKVTPVTIRSAYEKALSSFSQNLEQLGRDTIRLCHFLPQMPQEILVALGQLSFRSSTGQNVLKHSIEVAQMMGILAEELGLNDEKAVAMGLFHDIGKGLSIEWGNSHARAGKKLLQKWGIDAELVNAVAAHHGEEPPLSEEARLVPICDRLSAQLPGIRHSQPPAFLALVQQCEEKTQQVPHVLSSWAHYAGSHIELVVRHAPMERTEPLLQSLQEALQSAQLPIPVDITLVSPSLAAESLRKKEAKAKAAADTTLCTRCRESSN